MHLRPTLRRARLFAALPVMSAVICLLGLLWPGSEASCSPDTGCWKQRMRLWAGGRQNGNYAMDLHDPPGWSLGYERSPFSVFDSL